MNVDYLGAFSSIFLAIVFLLYGAIIYYQYGYLSNKSMRLQVLSTRSAACLPIYSILLYISLLYPHNYEFLQIGITFTEGVTLSTFFALIVVNIGGPSKTVQAMEERDDKLVCTKRLCACCCPENRFIFYKKSVWRLFHCVCTRTLLTTASAITSLFPSSLAQILTLLFSAASMVLLIYAVASLINFYDLLYDLTVNVHGLSKLLMIKTSVGFAAILHVAATFYATIAGGYTSQFDRNAGYSPALSTKRAYCSLMIIIFDAFAIVFFFSFAAKMDILQKQSSIPTDDVVHEEDESTQTISFCQFLMEIHKFYDLYPLLAINAKLSTTVVPVDLNNSDGSELSGYHKIVTLPPSDKSSNDERAREDKEMSNQMKVSSSIPILDEV